MGIKTTGIELKRFYADDDFWPDDAKTYYEDEVLIINGVYNLNDINIDVEAIPDDARVTIIGGTVFSPKWPDKEPSLETYFKQWKKKQTSISFVVECDKSKVDAVKSAIKSAGGKV